MPSSILSGLLWDIQYLTSVKAMLNLYMMARRRQGSLSVKNEWETLGLLPVGERGQYYFPGSLKLHAGLK